LKCQTIKNNEKQHKMKLIRTTDIVGIKQEIFILGKTTANGYTHKLLKRVTLESGTVNEDRYQGTVIEDRGRVEIVLGHRYK